MSADTADANGMKAGDIEYPTGDSSPIALYLLLLAAAAAGIGAVVVTAKRKRNKE